MSSSKVRLTLSDTVVENFYNIFGGRTNLSATVNELLAILVDEAERHDSLDAEEVLVKIKEALA